MLQSTTLLWTGSSLTRVIGKCANFSCASFKICKFNFPLIWFWRRPQRHDNLSDAYWSVVLTLNSKFLSDVCLHAYNLDVFCYKISIYLFLLPIYLFFTDKHVFHLLIPRNRIAQQPTLPFNSIQRHTKGMCPFVLFKFKYKDIETYSFSYFLHIYLFFPFICFQFRLPSRSVQFQSFLKNCVFTHGTVFFDISSSLVYVTHPFLPPI